jgi:GrpB-like predicted nucleotidyltransferase (UPF0157 family)
MQKIEIIPQHLFRTEADKLIPAFGRDLVALHHLGSISQFGPLAKPIVEIWVEVADIEKMLNFGMTSKGEDDQVIDPLSWRMVELGYTPWGEQGVTGRRFFSKDSDPVATYHIHVYQFGHFQPGYQQDAPSWGTLMEWLAVPAGAEPRRLHQPQSLSC